MTVARRTSSAGALFSTLLALALASASAAVLPTHALAEACGGSGGEPCPYTQAQIIGRRAEGVLRLPEAVAVEDSAAAASGRGSVYVADQLSYVVRKFSSSGSLETEWGSYGAGPGQFGPIGGLATDAAGNVYVVDSSHNRVEKFDSDGEFLTQWGQSGSGLGQFHFGSSQDPSIPPGGGIAVAGDYVYVADTGNDRIERFDLEGGEAFEWGSSGSGPGEFSHPRGVAANASEVIVADDDNQRIDKFDPAGDFQSSIGTQGKMPGQFENPYGVALDAAGDVYVADDTNGRVEKFSPGLSFLGAWGGRGSEPGQLVYPRALASDPAGDTYVADTANDRVEVFDPTGDYLRTIGAPVSPVPPGLRVSLTSDAGILARRSLALDLRCQRRCSVRVAATLSPRGKKTGVRLSAAARRLRAWRSGHVRLVVGPGAVRRLGSALGRGAAMTARVRILAAGPAGSKTTVSQTYAVSR
jgi:DNA-binding beta-propeller fold protein YncE